MLAVGAYAGWYRLSGEGRLPAETSLQVPQRLAPLAEQAVRAPSNRPPAVAATVPAPTEPPAQQAEAPPHSGHFTEFGGGGLGPARSGSRGHPRIVLRANADAWVQVRDRAGAVLLNRTLHSGETWDVPARPNLLLTTGNAGGTDLLVDGVAAPSLGGSGAVRRDLPLDPDLIRDGKLAATAQRANPQ